MGYWFQVSFSHLQKFKRAHNDFEEQISRFCSEKDGTVILARRPGESTYFLFTSEDHPPCLNLLLEFGACRCEQPVLPVEFVLGDKAIFDDIFGEMAAA